MQMSYFIGKIVFIVSVNLAIVGGAVGSWLACSTPDPGSRASRGHCVVFLGQTLHSEKRHAYTHQESPST